MIRDANLTYVQKLTALMGFPDASAGSYANNLHLAPDRYQPDQHLITQFSHAGCSSWHPDNSVKALKAFARLCQKWVIWFALWSLSVCILFSFVQLSIIRIENEKMHTERCHKASQITHFLAQKCKRCSNQHLKIHNQLIILSNVVIYIINISISVSMAICQTNQAHQQPSAVLCTCSQCQKHNLSQ